MSKAALSEEIKVRTDGRMKIGLEDIAIREGLDLSDIARRAFRLLLQQEQSRSNTLTTGYNGNC